MNDVYAVRKGIKTNKIDYQKVTDPINVSKILEVISKLLALQSMQTAKINELKLDSNPLRWISLLMKARLRKIRRSDFEYLLSSFTDRFKTRMREDSKYAIGLLSPDGLLLSHSIYGEETITPNWNTIPRMLDTGNILRYVYFYYDKGIINVKFWEKTSTVSFMDWLGLSRKQGFLFGGACSINTQIDGMTAQLELTEDEMDKLIEEHPEFRDAKIKLSSSIQLVNVNHIRFANKNFEKVQDFLQLYEADKHGIPLYQKKYAQFKENALLPLWFQYFDTKTALIRYESGEVIIEISKDLPELDILFVNDAIKFDEGYIDDLTTRIINNEAVNIFHIDLPFQSPPEAFGKVKIFNKLASSSIVEYIVNYYNETEFHDSKLLLCAKCLLFALLGHTNRDLPISHFFNNVSTRLINSIDLGGRLAELEGKIIEYKSRDIFVGNDIKIAGVLASDIKEKLKNAICKIYIIGVEDDGIMNPISRSRLRSDRIENIRGKLQSQLSPTNVFMLPIVQDQGGIIIIIVHRL